MKTGIILLATSNQGKISELKRLLGERPVVVETPADHGIDEFADEDADTLEGNAIKKARHIFNLTNIPTLADDTGLEVSELDGKPGVHSARYAGLEGDAVANRRKLLHEMMGADDRSARFRTVLAYVTDNGIKTFEGSCDGYILQSEKGGGGFGYDPVFRPAGYEKSFAEMTIDGKNKVSHRARALRKFVDHLDAGRS